MSKNAAKEGALGALHTIVAQVLAKSITKKDKVYEYDADGCLMLDEDGQPIFTEEFATSPQMLAVAVKFLKDNEITAQAEQSEAVANLEDEVAKRREQNKDRAARIKEQRQAAMDAAKAK